VQLKSKEPWTWAHADNFGLMQEPRSRFNMISGCGRSWSQKCFVDTVEARNKLILERAYGALSSTAPMYSWGYELEVDVIGLHKLFE
jgi:hypothetical protein